MVAAGADDKVMANWFPLALGPSSQKWIMHQPEGSIRSWRDMCDQFVNAFQGGYKRPGTMNDLYALVRKSGEMLRHFMQRFSHISHDIPEAVDAAIITAFSANVRDVKMREVVEHHLAVCPGARPVQQKVRRQAQDRQDFIVGEVHKLKQAKIIREVLHPTWMANPMVVPKANGKKRLCINFTDLNKACPKDPFHCR